MFFRVLIYTITIASWYRQTMTAPAYEVISQSTDFLGGDTVYESPKTSLTSVHVSHDQHDHSQNGHQPKGVVQESVKNKKIEKQIRKTDEAVGEHKASQKQEELPKNKHEVVANRNNYKEKDTSKQNYEKTKGNNYKKEENGLSSSISKKNGNPAGISRIDGTRRIEEVMPMPISLNQYPTAAVHHNHADCPDEQHGPIYNHFMTGAVNLETFPVGETNHEEEGTRNLEYWINLGKEYANRGYDHIFGDNGRIHDLNIHFDPEYLN